MGIIVKCLPADAIFEAAKKLPDPNVFFGNRWTSRINNSNVHFDKMRVRYENGETKMVWCIMEEQNFRMTFEHTGSEAVVSDKPFVSREDGALLRAKAR